MDNGFTDPFCWLWFAVDEDGTVYIYREYSRTRDSERVYYTQQAKEFMRRCVIPDEQFNEMIPEDLEAVVLGLDAWNKHHRDVTNKTILDYYVAGGFTYPALKAHTDRRIGKATVAEYLRHVPIELQPEDLEVEEPVEGSGSVEACGPIEDDETGATKAPVFVGYTSRVKIFNTCVHLIKSLPVLLNDENDPEMVADSQIDHPYDAMRYGLNYHHSIRTKVKEITPENRLQEHKKRISAVARRRRIT